MELQRLESLLKLYQAAGDIPEVKEIGKSSDARLSIVFKDSKLGPPKWINGNCGLTTTANGFWINAGAQPGTFARVLFEKILVMKTNHCSVIRRSGNRLKRRSRNEHSKVLASIY